MSRRRLCGIVFALLALAPVSAAWSQAAPPPAPRSDIDAVYEFAATALASLIQTSRDEILKSEARPIPPDMRRRLADVFSADVLDRVRYRVTSDGTVGLQIFQYGEVQAMTLIDVVVFRNERDAQTNDALWAHELTHVKQYSRWGVEDFARRYVRDHNAVEDEAYGFQAAYEKRRASLN